MSLLLVTGDLEMKNIWKVVGPPGTGKTTYVVHHIEKAVNKLTHSRVVLSSSLTRAAAIELDGRLRRAMPEVNGELLTGTLHSHALNALGRPSVFGGRDNDTLVEWNELQKEKGRQSWTITSTRSDDEDGGAGKTDGDKLLHEYGTLRSRLTPRELWPPRIARFADHYDKFKRDADCLDFADMIDLAYNETDTGPGVPQFMFVDEAQDHDRAQFRLIKKWAARPEVEHVIVVGDPKQNLYEWRGSEPAAFHELTDDDHKRVLSKSYRVPRKVWEVARGISRRITDCPDDHYEPRDGDAGEIELDSLPFTLRATACDVVGRAMDKHPGESLMFLATGNYMLAPALAALRDAGIPFHNPYKRDSKRLNPLMRGSNSKATAVDRVLAFMAGNTRGAWTQRELSMWTDAIRISDVLIRGAKAEIDRRAKKAPHSLVCDDDLIRWFQPDELPAALTGGVRWLESRVKLSSASHYSYVCRIYRRHGQAGLVESPRVIVGTIHSVKGGEADVVYLATDLSMREREGFVHDPNPVHRKMYVAATRARRKLVVCAPGISKFGAYQI